MHTHGQSDEEIAEYYTITPCSASLGCFLDGYDQLLKTYKEVNCKRCQAIFKPKELNKKGYCQRCRR